jgi:hypothetical protein
MRDKPAEKAIDLIIKEYLSATSKNGPFNSAHEGFAVLHEEFDELKTEVWKNASKRDKEKMLREAIQVAAMGMRFAVDICLKEEIKQEDNVVYLAGSIYGKASLAEANDWRLKATEKLEAAGYIVLNPLRDKEEGIEYMPDFIVHRDLDDIKRASILLVEMNTPGVPIAGTSMEIRKAFDWGKRIILWGTANRGSYWLQYHKTEWVDTLEEALDLLGPGEIKAEAV